MPNESLDTGLSFAFNIFKLSNLHINEYSWDILNLMKKTENCTYFQCFNWFTSVEIVFKGLKCH